MKLIYWIDDDFEQMFYIIQGAILKLWNLEETQDDKNRIKSNIIIFGDAFSEHTEYRLPQKEEEQDANNAMLDMYGESCFNIDGPNSKRPVFYANKDLVENAVTYLFTAGDNQDITEYKKIKEKWGKLDNTEKDFNRNDTDNESVSYLLDKMCIKVDAVVGIDICLLCGDYKKVQKSQIILSMELYNQLVNRGFKCFLYSSDAGTAGFSERWEDTYRKAYLAQDENEAKIEIYQRKDFLSKGKSDVVLQIRKLFDTGDLNEG